MDLERRIGKVVSAWYKHTSNKRLVYIAVSVVIAGLIAGLYIASSAGVVPKSIQNAVPFSIYYPKNLPAGYKLDRESFRLAEAGVVLFTVTYGEGKDIVFSEQQQPSSNEMDKFISSYIPLSTTLQLPLGQAKVGAYGSAPNIRTAVSLPIDTIWIIVTAPPDVSRDDLSKILQSLTK